MSLNNLKVLAETTAIVNNEGEPVFRTTYRIQQPVGGHETGLVDTPASGLTETAFNLGMAQAVADRANLESANLEQFTASDVIGGRL